MIHLGFLGCKTMLFLTMFYMMLGLAVTVRCQNTQPKNSSTQLVHQQVSDKDVKPLPYAEKGTYQLVFRFRSAEENVVLSQYQLEKLEKFRDESNNIYVRISDYTVVKLLPKQLINSAGFFPPPETIYIVEEKNFQDYINVEIIDFNNPENTDRKK